MAFDKTGTLTSGRPGVVAVVPFGEPASLASLPAMQAPHPPLVDDQVGALSDAQVRLLVAAAAIEQLSEHPLAHAVVRAATERGMTPPDVEDFTALSGMGAQARIGELHLRIGRPTPWSDLAPEIAELVQAQEQQGRTVVLLGDQRSPFGLIAIADMVRPEAAAAVAKLKQLGVARVVLLTGDNRHAAGAIGAALGVDVLQPQETFDAAAVHTDAGLSRKRQTH